MLGETLSRGVASHRRITGMLVLSIAWACFPNRPTSFLLLVHAGHVHLEGAIGSVLLAPTRRLVTATEGARKLFVLAP